MSRNVTAIGLISDTHGLLRKEALRALEGSELIIHAGDVGSPEILDTLFLAALARYPKPAERVALEAQLTAAKNRDEVLATVRRLWKGEELPA